MNDNGLSAQRSQFQMARLLSGETPQRLRRWVAAGFSEATAEEAQGLSDTMETIGCAGLSPDVLRAILVAAERIAQPARAGTTEQNKLRRRSGPPR